MGATLVDSLLTISDSSWDAAIWNFGGDNNFPILRSFDANTQGAAIADGLTRIVLPISGNALPVFPPGAVATVDSDYSILRLDTNGLAPNIGGGANPPPSCAFADGRLSASTYNGVVVTMRVLTGGAAQLTPYNDADCLAGLSGNPGEATLRLSFVSGGYSFYRDYRLTITAETFAPPLQSPFFVAPTEERFTVNLDSVVGEGVLTVSVDGISPRIFDATVEGFSTGGGSLAVVTLLSALDSIFTRDEQLIMMTLRADDALRQTASYTVTLASQPLTIDGEPFSNLFLAAQATAGATVAPAAAVNARIWHLFEQRDTRRFTLLDDAGGLFRIAPGNGEVSFARTATADDFATHELTLILLGGDPELTARQSARIRIRELPFAYIDDEDNEDKGEGTPADPFLIYDVYQLQAINGELPNEAVAELTLALNMTADAVISLAATVFGTTTIERLSRHYRLAVDIEAAVARGWNGGAGFAPIGDMDDFTGGFDGGGYAIRDLRISVSGGYAGLFTGIGAAATISDLLLQEIDVSGGDNAGALAGRLRDGGLISRVGAYGRVVGATVGGLAGIAAGGTVSQSWFAGEVVARGDGGGLFGSISAAVDVDRAWTAARVSAAAQAGGLSPNFAGRIEGSWAAGELEGAGIGGLAGTAAIGSQAITSYWSVDTTGADSSTGLGMSIARVEQVTDLGSGWNVGGGEDFPVLTVLSESPQKLGVAYGLTRLQAVNKSIRDLSRFGVNESGEDFAVMRLDLDGAADGIGVACVYDRDAGVLRANPGYNDLRIVVSLVGDGGVIQQYDDDACLFGVSALAGDRTLRLRYESAAGAALVVDYALSLAVDITAPGPAVGPVVSFVDAVLGGEIVIPSKATLGYPALTVNVEGINPMLSLLDDGFVLSVSSSPATLLLGVSAETLFASDGLRVTAELSALDFLGRGTRATAVFRSAPLGRDGPSVIISLPQERLVRDEVVLSTSDVGIEIWHYAGATMFSLLTDAPDIFGVFANNGRVYLRRSLDSSDYGNYNLTLVGSGDDGVRGEQALEVGIGRLPFIYSSGQKGSGSADEPFRIFDIYQLQAIAGTLSSEAAAQLTTATNMSVAVLQSLAANVFGDESARLGAHYRLINDIDAASTREWGDAGFTPIGGDFTGVFDGGGMVVSSLFIDLLDDDNPVGLFAGVNGGAVSSVGLAQARVTGGANVGALIGVLSGDGRVVGVRVLGGLVVGGTVFSPNSGIGGLVGRADQSRVAASWSSAEVVGLGQTPVGGLIGQQGGSEATVAGSWSSGRVSAPFDHGGGLIGLHEGGQIEESWSLSEIIDLGLGGGLVGSRTSALAATNSYWSVETSGLTVSGDGIGVDTLQTLTVGQLSSLYWNLGETPDLNFPLLGDLSAVEQAIGIGARNASFAER